MTTPWTFRCPRCGSTYFATDAGIGRCKGRLSWTRFGRHYAGCDYTWPRSEDARVGAYAEMVTFEVGMPEWRAEPLPATPAPASSLEEDLSTFRLGGGAS